MSRPSLLSVLALLILLLIAHDAQRAFAALSTPTYVVETFRRSVPSGWGSAEAGGVYELRGTAADFNVAGSAGTMRLSAPAASLTAYLPEVTAQDVDMRFRVNVDKLGTGDGPAVYAIARRVVDQGLYQVKIRFDQTGAVVLRPGRVVMGNEVAIGSSLTLPQLTYAAGGSIWVRAQFIGTIPTMIQARVWADGQSEPTAWMLSTTDAEPVLQAAGMVGLRAYLSADSTNAPLLATFDDWNVSGVDAASNLPTPSSTAAVTPSVAPTSTPIPTAAPTSTPLSTDQPVVSSLALSGVPDSSVDTIATNYPIPSNAFFVATSGKDTNAGTQSSPWRTIQKAVTSAPSGSTIVIRQGTYRENARFADKQLTIQPYPNEKVLLKGSIVVSGWIAEGNIWRKDGWATTFKQGGLSSLDPSYPLAAYPDMAFINGKPLLQASSKSAVGTGKFYVDYANKRLYIGDNPDGKTIEVAALSQALEITNGDSSVVRGLGFMHFATHIDENAAVSGRANRLTFENNLFARNAAAGLSVVGTDGIVRGNKLIYNGQLGLHASRADRLVVERNMISSNNQEHFSQGFEAGGLKITRSSNMSWRDNIVERNIGDGMWCDVACQNPQIVRNIVRNNLRYGIEFEISSRALIASNIIANNGTAGVNVSTSNDVGIYNNTFSRNPEQIRVVDDDRSCTDLPVVCATTGTVIRNNIFSDGTSTSLRLLLVDDYSSAKKTGAQMVNDLNYNAYYRSDALYPKFLVLWTLGLSDGNYSTLAKFQAAAGEDRNSIAIDNTTTNPFFVDLENGDYRLKSGSPALNKGMPLSSAVADAIGVAPGVTVNMGALKW